MQTLHWRLSVGRMSKHYMMPEPVKTQRVTTSSLQCHFKQ